MKKRQAASPDNKPARSPALDRQQIVRAALDLLDEGGMEGVTMRGLAGKLGIKAASLYWHVRDKQELLGLLAEEICAEMRAPDPGLPWAKQVEALAHEYRRILLSRRGAAQVLAASRPPTGPNRLRLTETVLGTLLKAGFDHKTAAYAGLLLVDYVTMFVLGETQYSNGEKSGEEAGEGAGQRWTEAVPPEDYPSLAALSPYLTQPDADEHFRFGIKILQKGLESASGRGGNSL